jgi:hypothetical protein
MGSLLKRSLVTALLVLMAVLDASAAPLSPGVWTILDQPLVEGDFFTGGPWTFTNTVPVVFRITDLFVVSDRYEVYDNGFWC